MQIVRDWVVKFNAHGPAGLIDRKPPGQPARLTDAHRAALVQVIEDGPIPSIHDVVRWRLIDLFQWFWNTFEVRIAKPTLSRELRALGYRKLTARPRHHAQAEGAIEAFKKSKTAKLIGRFSAPVRQDRCPAHGASVCAASVHGASGRGVDAVRAIAAR